MGVNSWSSFLHSYSSWHTCVSSDQIFLNVTNAFKQALTLCQWQHSKPLYLLHLIQGKKASLFLLLLLLFTGVCTACHNLPWLINSPMYDINTRKLVFVGKSSPEHRPAIISSCQAHAVQPMYDAFLICPNRSTPFGHTPQLTTTATYPVTSGY